ncbi:MAG TPA: carboxylesterase family protein [Thermoanaerobaculia bacterium]|nr:carboxylesterase family protein [Thermoanaerobaculia bacterium]
MKRRVVKILFAGLAASALRLSALEGPAAAPAPAEPPKVRVESGLLAGVEEGGARVFRGIPYAAPPVGPLRWKAPQPPAAWSGERKATAAGPICTQPVENGEPVSEDCLTLQVFAPKAAGKAPVMVWVHGGANVFGAGSKPAYDGSAFARDGVILVAFNYRLGPLGFFAHPALTHAARPDEPLASYGVMDQIAALQWVRSNIAAFGGDPENVTLFGESAGGLDTLVLLSAPSAHGLFKRAIVESPGRNWEPLPTLAAAETIGAQVAAHAGLTAGATAEQLRALPAAKLFADPDAEFGPVADGRLLPESPAQAFLRGHALDVPLIIGSNSYEASLRPAATMKLADLPADLKTVYASEATTESALGVTLFNDRFFNAPVRWFARRAAAGAPAWLYHFSYVRPSQRSKDPGAPHASEIPYVFDSWDKLSSLSRLLPAETRAVTATLHSCWVTFAKTGVPTCQGAPAWAPYSPERDELMEFGPTATVRQHFRQPQLDAQDRVAAKFLPSAEH